MKRFFMAGLPLLLPVLLTIIITVFLVNLLTQPFQGIIYHFVHKHHLTEFGSPEIILILSKIFILIALTLFIFLLGFIGRAYLVYYFFRMFDALITHIPIVNRIYKPIQDGITTLFAPGSGTFSQVVLVPYPKANTWTIGLISQKESNNNELISVFVPGTPNPTGYMLLLKKEQMVFVDMSVDEAMRFIFSCGVISAPFMKPPTSN